MTTDTKTMQDMLRWFADSPTAKKIASDAAKAKAAKRAELVEHLAAIESQRAIESEQHITQMVALRKKIEELEKPLVAAATEMNQLRHEMGGAEIRHNQQVGRLKRELNGLSPDLLTEFVDTMWREYYRTQQTQAKSSRSEETTLLGLRKVVWIETTLPAIERRLVAIRSAIRAAEALRYQLSDDLQQQLDQLRQSIPAVVSQRFTPEQLESIRA